VRQAYRKSIHTLDAKNRVNIWNDSIVSPV